MMLQGDLTQSFNPVVDVGIYTTELVEGGVYGLGSLLP